MKTYSFKKGFIKGLISVITIVIALIAFAGFSDLTIWGLLEQYIKPLLGTLTVGGAFTMLLNYIKVKNSVE
ncbi:MAG: hypothetical protein WC763_04795 [Candidatus Paceibacterota bacterium]|jgi:hypothetical protein